MTASHRDYSEKLDQVEGRFKKIKEKWHENGNRAWDIYLGDQPDIPFNILFSNTQTIVPAVFSRRPAARVTRRHDEARADLPAKVAQRMLNFCMDTNLPSMPQFLTAVEDVVLDAALPGQGIARVRDVDGVPALDVVEWDKFAWGYCTRWEMCPWVAFAHDMTPEEVLEKFDKDMTAQQKAFFKTQAKQSESDSGESDEKGEKRPYTVRIWELWDKRKKERCWLCDQVEGKYIVSEPDPLRLEGFFPVPPMPLTFIHSTTDTMPRPLYKIYQQQAEELNEITRRLTKIIKAVKVRGLYAAGMDDIKAVFEQDDDNVLVPSQGVANVMQMGKGLDAYIWLMPVKELMAAAKELYIAREAVKSTIYEILGIGDILRGVSKASETLGAQEIKDKWGSLRINVARERTARFIRDCLRLMLDCAAKNTPEDLWAQITGVPLKSAMEVQVMAAAGQQVPPEQTWAGVLSVLQKDLSRAYMIDVESNSTVDASATGEREEVAEFMNAFGQSMTGLRDLMQSSPQGWELGKTMLLSISAKFDLGEDLAPMLKALPPPASANQPPPELQKTIAEVQKRMQEVARREEAAKGDTQLLKDMMQEIKASQEAVRAQEKALAMQREAFRREQDSANSELELARREALLEVKMEKVNLAGEKAAFAGEKAAVAAQAKATAQAAGRKPQGAK